jgi:hypothetical protein
MFAGLRAARPGRYCGDGCFAEMIAGRLPRGTFAQQSIWFISLQEDEAMKLITTAIASALAFSSALAFAQSGGAPSGRGSTTGDPAAGSATPGTSPTTGSSMKPSRSGSGTSTSGGSDANGDQGRDKMPDSNQSVRPNNKPDRM